VFAPEPNLLVGKGELRTEVLGVLQVNNPMAFEAQHRAAALRNSGFSRPRIAGKLRFPSGVKLESAFAGLLHGAYSRNKEPETRYRSNARTAVSQSNTAVFLVE